MLPAGKYVVEVVVPPGFELVKEEDKNILIGGQLHRAGDPGVRHHGLHLHHSRPGRRSAAPTTRITQTIPRPTWGPARIPIRFRIPLRARLGVRGQARVVPDFISLFPQSKEVSPFAGATRNLCDRKEVVLTDQMAATAKFYIYTSTHIAAKFTGVSHGRLHLRIRSVLAAVRREILAAQLAGIRQGLGRERNLTGVCGPVGPLQWSELLDLGSEPANPTGYSPTMMVMCMNDPGSGPTPDPLYQSGYSQFCYELPFMPGQTDYLDTPVVPTAGFSEGYNHPDCEYPDTTPAVSTVTGDVAGPWSWRPATPSRSILFPTSR